jgi:Acyl-CoA carboxylase epsilon subunit
MTETPLALAVLAGQPTADELAAVVVVLAARAGAAGSGTVRPEPAAQWAARSRLMRGPVTAGPGAWRASALPR